MTLLIAAKAGPGLRPNGTTFVFEPGIVIAADTRLSYINGTFTDDGLKVGITGPYGACGMASDSIDIPTQAFYYFNDFIESHPNILTTEAVSELRRLLVETHSLVSARLGRNDLRTTVFLGHNQLSPSRLSLYCLDSTDGFLPGIRDGFIAAGSHKSWALESFERIKSEYPTLKLHPFDGFLGT